MTVNIAVTTQQSRVTLSNLKNNYSLTLHSQILHNAILALLSVRLEYNNFKIEFLANFQTTKLGVRTNTNLFKLPNNQIPQLNT